MISVASVGKKYQEQVVSDVSFTVEAGGTLVLLGTSGSGKTTILKMINRLVEPSTGSIHIDGENISDLRPERLRRKMGYVIQQSGLFPHYSVGENIGLVPSLLGWSPSRIDRRVRELIKVVGLSESQRTRYPHELSGGQQQRVGIARALAADPPLILMDEPFGALDPITKQQMTQEFASLGMLREKTVVLVTHDVLEAFTLGDTICLLDAGKVQQLGRPQELLFRPANEFVRSFFRTQQLRLALEVLTLRDIAPYCSVERENLSEGKAVNLPLSTTIFSALDEIEKQQATGVRLQEEESRILDRGQLLSGLFEYQRTYASS